MSESSSENETNLEYMQRKKMGPQAFQIGDKVEANYFLEGTYYPGIVDSISDDGLMITVKYDDDGSTESLTSPESFDRVVCGSLLGITKFEDVVKDKLSQLTLKNCYGYLG